MIAAVVLAAGASTRFGRPKQPLLLGRVLANVRAAGLEDVVVVLGAHADEVRRAVDLSDVRVVVNDEWAEGMSTSIQAGIRALPAGTEAAMIVLGDQPYVAPATMSLLISEFRRARPDALVPEHDGRPGNPVILAASVFPALRELRGDTGFRAIAGRFRYVQRLAVNDLGVLQDVDTAGDLQ